MPSQPWGSYQGEIQIINLQTNKKAWFTDQDIPLIRFHKICEKIKWPETAQIWKAEFLAVLEWKHAKYYSDLLHAFFFPGGGGGRYKDRTFNRLWILQVTTLVIFASMVPYHKATWEREYVQQLCMHVCVCVCARTLVCACMHAHWLQVHMRRFYLIKLRAYQIQNVHCQHEI